MNNVLPVRLMLYVFLLAGILLAVFLDSVLGSRAPRRIALGGVTALIALAPLFPQLSFPSTSYPLPAFFTSSAAQRIPEGTVALIAPFSYFGENRAMLWQAYSGMRFRIPEAYAIIPGPSFNPPPSELGTAMIQIQLGVDPPTVSDGAIRQMREDLRRWKVGTVIVGPMEHEDRMRDLFTALLGHSPEAAGGVYVWWNAGRAWNVPPAAGASASPP